MAHRKTQPVALVPFVEDGKEPVGTDNLLQVAAALNIQAVRDSLLSWNVSAIVSPFSGVVRVPPGYDVIVILPKDSEFTGPKGFHFLDTGVLQSAVVNDADDWSLFASHELMETLVDRRGDRTASGPSLRSEQGRVDYLVEVCDPCQHSTYTIDGVLYPTSSHPATTAMRLAMVDSIRHTGRIKQPRTLLDGGYITWATQPPKRRVWQALAPVGTGPEPAVADAAAIDMGLLTPAQLTRGWIDLHPPTTPETAVRYGPNSNLDGGQPLTDAQVAFADATSAAARNGAAIDTLVSDVLQAAETAITLDIRATKALLQGLTTDSVRAQFPDNVQSESRQGRHRSPGCPRAVDAPSSE